MSCKPTNSSELSHHPVCQVRLSTPRDIGNSQELMLSVKERRKSKRAFSCFLFFFWEKTFGEEGRKPKRPKAREKATQKLTHSHTNQRIYGVVSAEHSFQSISASTINNTRSPSTVQQRLKPSRSLSVSLILFFFSLWQWQRLLSSFSSSSSLWGASTTPS